MTQCGNYIFDSLQIVDDVEIIEYIPLIKNEQLIRVQLKWNLLIKLLDINGGYLYVNP